MTTDPQNDQEGGVAAVLRIVSDWAVESNDSGGLDADDLVWRLSEAGYTLPDEGDDA